MSQIPRFAAELNPKLDGKRSSSRSSDSFEEGEEDTDNNVIGGIYGYSPSRVRSATAASARAQTVSVLGLFDVDLSFTTTHVLVFVFIVFVAFYLWRRRRSNYNAYFHRWAKELIAENSEREARILVEREQRARYARMDPAAAPLGAGGGVFDGLEYHHHLNNNNNAQYYNNPPLRYGMVNLSPILNSNGGAAAGGPDASMMMMVAHERRGDFSPNVARTPGGGSSFINGTTPMRLSGIAPQQPATVATMTLREAVTIPWYTRLYNTVFGSGDQNRAPQGYEQWINDRERSSSQSPLRNGEDRGFSGLNHTTAAEHYRNNQTPSRLVKFDDPGSFLAKHPNHPFHNNYFHTSNFPPQQQHPYFNSAWGGGGGGWNGASPQYYPNNNNVPHYQQQQPRGAGPPLPPHTTQPAGRNQQPNPQQRQPQQPFNDEFNMFPRNDNYRSAAVDRNYNSSNSNNTPAAPPRNNNNTSTNNNNNVCATPNNRNGPSGNGPFDVSPMTAQRPTAGNNNNNNNRQSGLAPRDPNIATAPNSAGAQQKPAGPQVEEFNANGTKKSAVQIRLERQRAEKEAKDAERRAAAGQ